MITQLMIFMGALFKLMQLVEATPLLTYEGFLAPWTCPLTSVMYNYVTKAET